MAGRKPHAHNHGNRTLTPAIVLNRLEATLNMKLGALQMTSFSDVLLKVIRSTIKVKKLLVFG